MIVLKVRKANYPPACILATLPSFLSINFQINPFFGGLLFRFWLWRLCRDSLSVFFKIHRYGSKDSRPDPSILQSRFPLFKSFQKVSVWRNIFIEFSFFKTIFYQTYFVNFFFSKSTSPPRSPTGLALCVPTYTLSSPTFKGWPARGLSFVCYERIVYHDGINNYRFPKVVAESL